MRSIVLIGSLALLCAATLGACGGSDDDDSHEHAASTPTCDAIMEACHPLDTGAGPIHECHELSEGGSESACVAKQAECLAMCKGGGGAGGGAGAGGAAGAAGSGGASAGAAGSGGSAAGSGGAAGAGGAGAGGATGGSSGGSSFTSVTLSFGAKVGTQPFSCSGSFTGLGTTKSTWAPKDFRLYVHDVALLDAAGKEAKVTLDQDGKWQYQNVALLDFEDKSGGCVNGTTDTNTKVVGKVAPGTYTGLRFTLGVPFALNHAEASQAPSPLNLTTLWWNWNGGYKFARIDGATTGLATGYNIHLGSTGCQGGDAVTSCDKPNRAVVTLTGFDPSKSVVVADLAKLVEKANLDQNQAMSAPGCMAGADDMDCAPLFESFGIDFPAGTPSAKAQTFFRVE